MKEPIPTRMLIGCPVLYSNVCQLMIDGMDPLNEKITIHEKEFTLRPSDFTQIMGIKDGGSEVDLRGDMRTDLFKSVAQVLTCGEGKIIVTSLKKIVVESTTPNIIFKIAYVLLVLVALLCPAGNEEIDKALLFPLLDTRRIAGKNWATFYFNRLFASVLTFKASHVRSNITCCMVFLQLYYFEAIGGSRGWIDKTLGLIQAWGVAEAMQLLHWIEQRGGFRDLNTAVWAPTTLNPFGDEMLRKLRSQSTMVNGSPTETSTASNMIGPGPSSDISQLSVSPGGPPKLAHRTIQCTVRDFTAAHFSPKEFVHGRYDSVVVARDDWRHVTRYDVASLAPGSIVSGMVSGHCAYSGPSGCTVVVTDQVYGVAWRQRRRPYAESDWFVEFPGH
ncbi:hypothetical protein M0R45_019861 [Rubus argutus]|uniref:Uncharacterized protein n=1 Tax=Rubus argutus TaxID=59490 RepID=A0AAW1X8L5_RUBAR